MPGHRARRTPPPSHDQQWAADVRDTLALGHVPTVDRQCERVLYDSAACRAGRSGRPPLCSGAGIGGCVPSACRSRSQGRAEHSRAADIPAMRPYGGEDHCGQQVPAAGRWAGQGHLQRDRRVGLPVSIVLQQRTVTASLCPAGSPPPPNTGLNAGGG